MDSERVKDGAEAAAAVRPPAMSFRRKAELVGGYAWDRIAAQVKAVAFITVWLALFQVAVLHVPIRDLPGVCGGILAVVVGLALFMEGLFLAIMPLGERCGLRLPARAGLLVLVAFAAVLGVTATFAEPAIGFLKQQGSAVAPWDAPLLYYLLNEGSGWLVGAVALGVGLAVVVGMFRFLRAWRLKPILFPLIPALLAVTVWAALDPRTAPILGLAWDSGGVTTGPVTVPLIIALGLGVSRIAGRGEEAGGGLGVVTLASALPVLAVLVLGLSLAHGFPAPGSAEAFFAPENRAAALRTVGGDEAALARLAGEAGAVGTGTVGTEGTVGTDGDGDGEASLGENLAVAAKAILPLVGVLLVALVVFVREKIPHPDEVVLGVVFSLAGLCVFNEGMEAGLSSLGNQTGRALPHAWQAAERPDKAVFYEGVLPERAVDAVEPDGTVVRYLPVAGAAGEGAAWIRFDEARYDAGKRRYEWVPTEPAIAGGRTFWGYALVLFFAFAMGVGATLAEPSLAALGVTLEELTTGTYKKSFLVTTVAVGVGVGMMAGFGRILFGWPLTPMLCGGYALALVLTAFSPEDITAIAWDSAGVTTGPITVPLVIAAGLGIGKAAGASEAFGVVTMASLCPIVAVLLSGLWVAARRQALSAGEGGPVGYRPGAEGGEEGDDDGAAAAGEVAP